MSIPKRKRFAFRPMVTESRLECRLVLDGATSAAAAVASPMVLVVAPPTQLAPDGVTPAPAPSPISASAAARLSRPLTVASLRKDYAKQVRAAARDLRSAIQTQLGQLYANGATPTAQQLADFNASVAGALNATALRLSVQASLLPNSGARLVPAIQNAILGSGPRSLASRLTSLAQSGNLSGSTGTSTRALTRLLNTSTHQTNSQLTNFFNTTPVNRLSVNSSGQHIPLQQFLGGQLINQVANTFGSLAQALPSVAGTILFPNGGSAAPPGTSLNTLLPNGGSAAPPNNILFPNGGSAAPPNTSLNTFNTQLNNALSTAAFELGSGLSLFPNTSGVVSQLQPMLFGVANGNTGTTGSTAATSLASALQNLQFGSTGFNTDVSNAFGTAFQNLVTPIARAFGMTGTLNTVLPTSGFSSVFGSPFTGSSFFNGFNSGFATGTTPGFIGFGMAPTAFNTSFGTGFNNFISGINQSLGFNQALGAGSGVNGISTGQVGAGSGVNGIGSGFTTGTGGGIA